MRAVGQLFVSLGLALIFAAFNTPIGSAQDPSPGAVKLAGPRIDQILRAHNAWRRKAGVLSLRWAPDLATTARVRAGTLAKNGCVIEHGLVAEDVGENLFHADPLRADGRDPALNPLSPTQVVDAWGAESADYSAKLDVCAPGRQCGHYTQVVWPNTEEVGCGMAICPNLGQVWVCHYRPKGNVRMR